jgi:hypothetical protein
MLYNIPMVSLLHRNLLALLIEIEQYFSAVRLTTATRAGMHLLPNSAS